MKFKLLISIIFIGLFFLRIWNPELQIDSISVILIVLSMVPWFIQYINSLEINGLGKVEWITERQKKELKKNANEAGIWVTDTKSRTSTNYTFYNLRFEDPKLALAGLRIELENTLIKLTQENSLDSQRYGLNRMTSTLLKHDIITTEERNLIYDISGILNRAVHSQLNNYDSESLDWVFDIGLQLLESLSKK